jgi:hypothetical protein
MTEADPDDIGPDGTVRLRCYLPQADTVWFSAGCQGRRGCGHSAPIGIRAKVERGELAVSRAVNVTTP